MATEVRPQIDALTKAVARDPGHHGLFVMLRELERLGGDSFHWGRTSTPAEEPIRVGQNLSLAFEGREIAAVRGGRRGQPSRVMQNIITLVGPAGPMPLHFAELVREREFSDGDPVLPRFLDMLIHRIITLFYRAWATNRIAVSADQPPETDWILRSILSVAGMTVESLQATWQIDPRSIATRVAHMARPTRGASQIREQLRHYFMVPVEVEQFTPCVTPISEEGRWSLRPQPLDSTLHLGAGVPLGRTTVELSARFRVIIGPVHHDDYVRFLPREMSRKRLEEWIHLYAGTTLDWDLHLLMLSEDAAPLQLGQGGRLRRDCWLGRNRPARHMKGYHRRFERIAAHGDREHHVSPLGTRKEEQ